MSDDMRKVYKKCYFCKSDCYEFFTKKEKDGSLHCYPCLAICEDCKVNNQTGIKKLLDQSPYEKDKP